MRSSWPIVVGVAFLGAAAAWYDAKNEATSVLEATNVHAIDAVSPSAAEASLARAEPTEAPEDRVLGTTKPKARPLVGSAP